MTEPLCDACGRRKAAVYQPHTRRKLCRECFIRDVVSRVEEYLKKWRLLNEDDKILLSLSGGKDSYVLLDVLSQIHNPQKIQGVIVDEGIEGYSRIEEARQLTVYARKKGVNIRFLSFKEYVGYTLPELVRLSRKKGLAITPCTICGGIRRRIVNSYARKIGADKTMTGHTLDDEVQTAIMNFLRGDPPRMIRQHPNAPTLSGLFVKRVKPLRLIYEWEVALYAYFKGFRFQEKECPMITETPTLRARIRRWLYKLEGEKPGTMLNIITLLDSLVEKRLKEYRELPSLPTCRICGEPTSYGREICKVCELLLKMGVEPRYTI